MIDLQGGPSKNFSLWVLLKYVETVNFSNRSLYAIAGWKRGKWRGELR